MFLFLFCTRRTGYIVGDNANTFIAVGLSCNDVILFKKPLHIRCSLRKVNILCIVLWSESRGNTVEKVKGSV